MNRRHLLIASGTVLAPITTGGWSTKETQNSTESPAQEHQHKQTVRGCETTSDTEKHDKMADTTTQYSVELSRLSREPEFSFEYDAEIVDGGIGDPRGPIGVKITITNTDSTSLWYPDMRDVGFDPAVSESRKFGLYAGQWDDIKGDEYEISNDYWKRSQKYVTILGPQPEYLEPDESYTSSMVLAVRRGEDPPERGVEQISFKTSFSVAPRDVFNDNHGQVSDTRWELTFNKK